MARPGQRGRARHECAHRADARHQSDQNIHKICHVALILSIPRASPNRAGEPKRTQQQHPQIPPTMQKIYVMWYLMMFSSAESRKQKLKEKKNTLRCHVLYALANNRRAWRRGLCGHRSHRR